MARYQAEKYKTTASKILVNIWINAEKNKEVFTWLYFFSIQYLGKKYFNESVSPSQLYTDNKDTKPKAEYNIPTSSIENLLDTILLNKYPAGAAMKVKKYNQKLFLINFCHNGSSFNNSESFMNTFHINN